MTASQAVPPISSSLASPFSETTKAFPAPLTIWESPTAGSLISNVGSELYFNPRPAWLSW